jgi:hypothetical protein
MVQQEPVTGTKRPRAQKGPDFGAVGPEHDNHHRAWQDVMDWTRLEIDAAQLKQAFVEWAKVGRDPDEIAHWMGLPKWHFMTIGRMAYCMLRGATPPESTIEWLARKLQDMLVSTAPDAEEDEPERQLDAAQRRNIEYVNLYSNLESYLSRFPGDAAAIEDNAKRFLARMRPNQQMLKRLYEHFKESLGDAMACKDNPLVANTIEPIIAIVNVLATSTGNAKAIRDSRGATNKSVKQASKAKFKSVDLNTDMASLAPALIPGSKTAIVYNAKTRKVSLYRASGDGFGIKGTKLTNVDEDASYSKTLRKPKEILGQLRDATNIRRVDVVLGYVKGKRHKASGKLNKDSLVLKVFR